MVLVSPSIILLRYEEEKETVSGTYLFNVFQMGLHAPCKLQWILAISWQVIHFPISLLANPCKHHHTEYATDWNACPLPVICIALPLSNYPNIAWSHLWRFRNCTPWHISAVPVSTADRIHKLMVYVPRCLLKLNPKWRINRTYVPFR